MRDVRRKLSVLACALFAVYSRILTQQRKIDTAARQVVRPPAREAHRHRHAAIRRSFDQALEPAGCC